MKIILPMLPTGINHMYHTNQGKWYKDQKIKDWETKCLWMLKKFSKPQDEVKQVHIVLKFDNKRKNDIDGRIKPILDLLQKGEFIEDDSQITRLTIEKELREKSEIEIIL